MKRIQHPNVAKVNKHRAKKVVIDNITFDSKKESLHYMALKACEHQGVIRDVIVHPTFQITWPTGEKICKVELDFMFFDISQDKIRYIDVKGWDKKTKKWRVTNESRIKKLLLEAQNKITVEYA